MTLRQKTSWLNKIKFFIIALIILVIGYLFGIIILAAIFGIIILISIFFLISLLFTKTVDLISNKWAKLFIKMIFASGIAVGLTMLLWKIMFIPIISKSAFIGVMIIWAFNAVIFGTLWNLLVVKKRQTYKNNVFEYLESKLGIQPKDVLFMLIIPSIITIVFNVIYGIV